MTNTKLTKSFFGNFLLATIILCQNIAFATDPGKTRELNTDSNRLCRLLFTRIDYALWSDMCSHSKGTVVPPFAIRSHNVEDYDEVADIDLNPKFHGMRLNEEGMGTYDEVPPRLQGLSRLVEMLRLKNLLSQLRKAQSADDDSSLFDQARFSFLRNEGDPESAKFYRSFDDEKSHVDRAGEKNRRDGDHELNHPLYLI